MQAGVHTRSFFGYVANAWQHVLPSLSKQANLRELGTVLRDYQLVCLQETDGGSTRSGLLHQAYFIAEYGGFAHIADQRNRRVGLAQLPFANSGNAILSRQPFVSELSLALPGPGRGLLQVELAALYVINVHLSLTARLRNQQLEFIHQHLQTLPSDKPVLVAGDFNCEPKSDAMKNFLRSTRLQVVNTAASFPSWRPSLHLDLVLHSAELSVSRARVLPSMFSDHLPVAVELEL